jgi:hypothetical protein
MRSRKTAKPILPGASMVLELNANGSTPRSFFCWSTIRVLPGSITKPRCPWVARLPVAGLMASIETTTQILSSVLLVNRSVYGFPAAEIARRYPCTAGSDMGSSPSSTSTLSAVLWMALGRSWKDCEKHRGEAARRQTKTRVRSMRKRSSGGLVFEARIRGLSSELFEICWVTSNKKRHLLVPFDEYAVLNRALRPQCPQCD